MAVWSPHGVCCVNTTRSSRDGVRCSVWRCEVWCEVWCGGVGCGVTIQRAVVEAKRHQRALLKSPLECHYLAVLKHTPNPP